MELVVRYTALAVMCAALAACGGGGGSPGATAGGGSSNPGSPTTGGGTGSPTTSAQAKTTVGLYNGADAAVSSISIGGGYVARATVLDAAGRPVANRLVTFSLNGSSIATLAPETALTNASGVAQTTISPSSVSSIGAGTLSAAATVDGTPVTGSADFAVTASSLSLSALTAASNSLASGGNTTLSVTALVGGAAAAGVPVNVTFGASCGKINNSSSGFSVTTDGTGTAVADYTAVQQDGSLCSGPVTLTASTSGATPRSVTVTVAAPTASAVTFVSATPAQIYVAGAGALEQSVLTFKVLSQSGTPMTGQAVNFTLPTTPAGVTLGAASGTTNSTGEVSVSLRSGSVPGPVKVRASLASDATVFTETQNLTIASGPPSQRFMSLSVETYNIEGAVRDGTPTRLTARIADRQGNAVEDGTVVNFTTEGGQVAYSCATLKVNNISSCSVDFASQNPRPGNGRVSVLAFTSGTKDYVDANGNNRFDTGDTLLEMGNAYRDDNENNSFESGEFVINRGGVLGCAGGTPTFPAQANTCDGLLATTVRQQAVILFSSSSAFIDITQLNTGVVQFALRSANYNLLPMPAGTTVEATAVGGTCAVARVSPSTVVNVSPGTNPGADLATNHQVVLDSCAAGNRVIVTIKAPSGLTTEQTFVLP